MSAVTDPLFSIVIPTFNTPLAFLREALDSVLGQSCEQWQLCLVDDASTDPQLRPILLEYAARDGRVEAVFLDENRGIAGATNIALQQCRGRYIVLMDHDDVLAGNALSCVAEAAASRPGVKLFYSDSDRISVDGHFVERYQKPDFDYDLLLGHNYLNHLTVLEASLLSSLGGQSDGYEGSQDYDLYLRAIESIDPTEVLHIPQVLYHWRIVESSVSATGLAAAAAAGRRAVQDHLNRRNVAARVRANPDVLIYNRVEWLFKPRQLAVLVYTEAEQLNEATSSAITAQVLPAGVLMQLDTLSSAGPEELSSWLDQQESEFVCLVVDGLVPAQSDALATLSGYFGRPEVAAVTPAYSDSTGERRIPAEVESDSEPPLWVFDRQLSELGSAGCVLMRREAFAGHAWTWPLRARGDNGCLIYSSQVVFNSLSADLDDQIGHLSAPPGRHGN